MIERFLFSIMAGFIVEAFYFVLHIYITLCNGLKMYKLYLLMDFPLINRWACTKKGLYGDLLLPHYIVLKKQTNKYKGN